MEVLAEAASLLSWDISPLFADFYSSPKETKDWFEGEEWPSLTTVFSDVLMTGFEINYCSSTSSASRAGESFILLLKEGGELSELKFGLFEGIWFI